MVPRALHLPARPAGRARLIHLQGLTMGTTWQVKVAISSDHPLEHSPQQLQRAIQERLDHVVRQMSSWAHDSDLSRFNRAPAGALVPIPDDLERVMSYALDVARDSGGACDPTAGALVNAWGFGPGSRFSEPGFTPPTTAALSAGLASSGWRRLQWPPLARHARQPGGLHLDLSAIAKGFGVDQVALVLRQARIGDFLVEVGGELCGAGVKPDGQPWWVALEDLVEDDGAVQTVVALHGLSIATSGDYRRFFSSGGCRFSHTIDPRTGWPVSPRVASVTVIHPQCMAADALSTALMVMGPQEGIAWADRRGVAALFRLRAEAAAFNGDIGERTESADGIAERLTERMTKPFADLLQ